jgi:excisionase family DNA binding protein
MARKWLSPVEAAGRLGVSESTVWRLLRRGQLASIKLGGRRRIAVGALRQARSVPERVFRPEDIPRLTLDDPLFRLAGKFRSDGSLPGASDKHFYLGVKR